MVGICLLSMFIIRYFFQDPTLFNESSAFLKIKTLVAFDRQKIATVPPPTTTGPTIPGTRGMRASLVTRPTRGRKGTNSSTHTTRRGETLTAMRSTTPLETSRNWEQKGVAERHLTAP